MGRDVNENGVLSDLTCVTGMNYPFKAFRRLMRHFSVCIERYDHYRTRLTHPQFAQVARTIAKTLNYRRFRQLLGHDLGHHLDNGGCLDRTILVDLDK